MSDKFSVIPLERLLLMILNEYWETGCIFGLARENFFRPARKDPFRMTRYGKLLETPIGVAAGPQTQMAQNIIISWLTGSRYIELKTIQTLDELDVSKPCIDMEDAGYNCEWSQELRLKESIDEYVNAWIIIHILRYELGLETSDELGGIFNISVGYNLEGILKPNVQNFFAKMVDCSAELDEKFSRIKKIYRDIKKLKIPAQLTDNITLSTMHGCPPDEIEKIGHYLMTEKKLNTTIKLNPTLLGPEMLREILNDKLGFETHVPDEAFGHDLKYPDALNLIRSLTKTSQEMGVEFSLKLTNTLECVNHRSVFPENEKMMYMSGRALHPISINLASKLQTDFDGQLDISFSAGADCFNLAQIIACGIKPVTVSSDMLKPGGYLRGVQYLEKLADAIKATGAKTIDQYILARAEGETDLKKAALANLKRYASEVVDNDLYHKSFIPDRSIKTPRPLKLFDCVKAPCVETCPTNQEIPEYLYRASKGQYKKAFEVIMKTNPLPTITGMVCDHPCMFKCTRQNYDTSLLIRDLKRFIVEQQKGAFKLKPLKSNGKKVVIIGAGPAGLTCAFYLALEGFAVKIYESKKLPGGMAADAIPGFRLTDEQIAQDIDRILALGVEIEYGQKIDSERFAQLRSEYDFVFVGIGSQLDKKMGLPGEDSEGVISALDFLSDVRRGVKRELGQSVAVVGAGNTAMDAARTAYRLVGAEGKVTILYRRTMAEMPADQDEIQAVLEEKIEIMQLVAPLSISRANGKVKIDCQKMELGEPDASGRRRPVPLAGSEFSLEFDTLIPAIGQDTEYTFVKAEDLVADPETLETKLPKVYAGGDVVHGALNLITAIGDGRKAAGHISLVSGGKPDFAAVHADKGLFDFELQKKSATRVFGTKAGLSDPAKRKNFDLVISSLSEKEAREEAARCLYCSDVCNVCVTVCPNRANFSYQPVKVNWRLAKIVNEGGQAQAKEDRAFVVAQDVQTANIADFCNECGNCETFCPTAGAPYRDKPKFCLTEESFNAESTGFFIGKMDGHDLIRGKFDGAQESLRLEKGKFVYESASLKAVLKAKDFKVLSVELVNGAQEADLERAAGMAVLLKSLAGRYLYR